MPHLVLKDHDSQHLAQFEAWCIAEWGAISLLDADGAMPSPILLLQGQDLLGGLAFTTAPFADHDAPQGWINAVLIAPEHRKQGLASRLIRAAEIEAAKHGRHRLYALTDIPHLYEALGWHVVQHGEAGHVLEKIL